MILFAIALHHACAVERCPPADFVAHRVFSAQALRMKAVDRTATMRFDPPVAPPVAPGAAPSGGGSGGGALLGGEGAPGSGTGIPQASGAFWRF